MRREREKTPPLTPGVHPVQRARVASAGFTLLEILLAVTLLAVVTALVYGAFGGTEKIVNAVVAEDRAYRMARDTLDTLGRDLASLGAAKGTPFLVSRDGRYPEAGRDISFLSRSTVPFLRESASGLSR
ncbi:MAG TPA: prepilin-type N-terminal cleavage/methylation domain-containing protein, partial [Syntrophales bacterium]|nr:prepilin-type N-terminal cleavage/methylation domain-containing protein [Syntrophales bacterium]